MPSIATRAHTPQGADSQRLLLTIPEVCEALGLGRSTVYELLNAGELESVHIRRTRRIPYEALLAYVARLRAAAAEAADVNE